MSEITYNTKGEAVSFVGADAVACYGAAVLASALGLMSKGIYPHRGITGKMLLQKATALTGKAYKRGEYLKAKADVSIWVQEMKSALPHVTVP